MTQPLADDNAKIRLSKLMAQQGICSRREADELISLGGVMVDGRVIDQLGTKVLPQQVITLTPDAFRKLNLSVTFLLHKPVGYVSGQPEPGYKPAVVLLLPENRFAKDSSPLQFHPRQLKGLAPAGRLDIDSSGLLVMTQNGQIARQLIGNDRALEKEYLVRVEGTVLPKTLDRLRHGLSLDDKPLLPAQVEALDAQFLKFILREGRKRQIRRMCEMVGLRVITLKRVRIGKICLGNLPLGQWQFLRPDEHF